MSVQSASKENQGSPEAGAAPRLRLRPEDGPRGAGKQAAAEAGGAPREAAPAGAAPEKDLSASSLPKWLKDYVASQPSRREQAEKFFSEAAENLPNRLFPGKIDAGTVDIETSDEDAAELVRMAFYGAIPHEFDAPWVRDDIRRFAEKRDSPAELEALYLEKLEEKLNAWLPGFVESFIRGMLKAREKYREALEKDESTRELDAFSLRSGHAELRVRFGSSERRRKLIEAQERDERIRFWRGWGLLAAATLILVILYLSK